MKKKLMMMLAVSVLLVGCGSADTTDNAQGTETPQTQEAQKQEEPTHEHNYTESITTEATCETDGVKTFTCECGDSYTEVITATGHIYENYVSNNDATYLADGTETAKCNTCDLTDTRTAEGSKLEYTYTDLDKTMYAKQSVNVRDLPTADGNKLGGLSSAQEVKVLGQCNETSWYKIEFDGGVAYVSNSYLQDSKPEQQTAQQSGTTNNTASTSTQNFPHALNAPWYDAGTGEVYFYTVGTANVMTEPYTTAFAMLDPYIQWGRGPLKTVGSKFNEYVGTYAEGDIYLSSAHIHYYDD